MLPLSIEAYLLVNFLMDALLLFLALRSCGRPLKLRILAGSALGTAYAIACLWTGPWLRSIPCQMAVLASMLAAADGSFQRLLRNSAAAFVVTMCIAGACQLAQERSAWSAGAAVAVCACLIAHCQNRRQLENGELQVRIRIELRGRTAEFDAWIDTGNRLQEPVSGLPVLIVESRCVAGILPQSRFFLRYIPYGGLGGSGFLRAFRPDSVQCATSAGWKSADPVWVALYPGRISGHIHALAPPVFALRTANGPQNIREER